VRRARAGEGRQLTATNRSYLQQQAYADSGKLSARASIYRYREPPGSIPAWAAGLVDWQAGRRALDVGCGPGYYLRTLRTLQPEVAVVGVDLSPGMAREALAHAPTLTGDIASLPFPDATFDVAFAPHMLYHCPDIDAALRSVQRVLVDGGTLVAVTNGADHLAEMWDVLEAVTGGRPTFVADRFNLDTGRAFVDAVFESVRLETFFGTVAVPDADALVRYMASMQHFAGANSDDVLRECGARIQAIIDRDGVFRIRARSGAFVCQ
jgi:SAM-dependent methyltransferase